MTELLLQPNGASPLCPAKLGPSGAQSSSHCSPRLLSVDENRLAGGQDHDEQHRLDGGELHPEVTGIASLEPEPADLASRHGCQLPVGAEQGTAKSVAVAVGHDKLPARQQRARVVLQSRLADLFEVEMPAEAPGASSHPPRHSSEAVRSAVPPTARSINPTGFAACASSQRSPRKREAQSKLSVAVPPTSSCCRCGGAQSSDGP
jgi:hypothetical protein